MFSLQAEVHSQKAIANGSPAFSERATRLAKNLAAHNVNYPHFCAIIISEKVPEQSHSKIAANAELLNRLMQVAERAYPLNNELGQGNRIALLRLPYTLTKLRLEVLPKPAHELEAEISRWEKDLGSESALRYGGQKESFFAHAAEVAALREMLEFKRRFDAMGANERREITDFLKSISGK